MARQAPHPVSLEAIEAARDPVARLARVTPLLPSRRLSELAGASVWLKAEVLQRTGSFKVRGAVTFMASLDREVRQRGVIAASAGNHAQGVAVAAAAFETPCRIVMPIGSALPKERATREYGAALPAFGSRIRANSEPGGRGKGYHATRSVTGPEASRPAS